MGDKTDTLAEILTDALTYVTDELARIMALIWRKGGATMRPEDRWLQRTIRKALGGAAVASFCGAAVVGLLSGFTPLRAVALSFITAFLSCSLLITGVVAQGALERNTRRRIKIEVDRIQAAHNKQIAGLRALLDTYENVFWTDAIFEEEGDAARERLDNILTPKRGGRPATQLTDDDLTQLDAAQTAYKGGWKAFNGYCKAHQVKEQTMRDRMRRYAPQLAEWRARNKPPGGIVA